MGTISDKLTYLNDTKTKIRDGINAIGGSLDSDDTFRSYADELDNLYNEMPKVSANNVQQATLNNTKQAKMTIDLKGNTSQYSTTGINLLPNITTQELNGITITNNGDGSYTLNGTASANTYFDFYEGTFNSSTSVGYYLKEYNFDNIKDIMGVSSSSPLSYRISTSNRTTIQQVNGNTIGGYAQIEDNGSNLYLAVRIHNRGSLSNVKIKPMLVASSSSLTAEVEPYTGGSPAPSPSYPFDIHNVSGDNTIEICGKNLFDKDSEDVGHVYSSTGSYGEAAVWTTSDWIAVESNTQYSLSFKTTGTANLFFSEFNKNKEFIQRTTTGSLTPQSNTKYVRLSYKNDLGTYDIQLEKGSTSSEYEAYTGASNPINLPVENLFDYTLFNNFTIGNQTLTLTLKPNTTYIMSSNIPAYSVDSSANLFAYNSTSSPSTKTNGIKPNIPRQITTNADGIIKITYRNLGDELISPKTTYWYQIELGTKANSYTPYGTTPIELCKISTYQDYIYKEDDKWYLHKEIGKVVLDGSETWALETNGSFGLRSSNLFSDRMLFDTSFEGLLSNYYKVASSGDYYIRWRGSNEYNVNIKNKDISVASDFQFWLSTHNTIVYYVLDTPTNTEITDNLLINQLNTILYSYNGQTNVSQSNNDEAFILDVTALKDWSTLSNSSNVQTLSLNRPTLSSLGSNELDTNDTNEEEEILQNEEDSV